ncbi:hypothetical protein [Brasilonema sp. UFV-L1]|uniref:hypothetical protein n=1 Tax=Brasilonema sp. UFV-L1 TaxID=2234130 RepID=UPI00145E2B62|nr:hypothetical protein [Brasilonema sp. UFV-L1]NMG10825.1 hypothetical protein [Brasilonema sp. UFV-L1]
MLTICTASFFEPSNHTGKLLGISSSSPKGYESIEKFTELIPSPDLLVYWKNNLKKYKSQKIGRADLVYCWEKYTTGYHKLLTRRRRAIEIAITRLSQAQKVCTLLCWEKSNIEIPNCHRNLAGVWLAKEFNCKHYQDKIPPVVTPKRKKTEETLRDWLEKKSDEFAQLGIFVKIVQALEDEEDFFYLYLNDKYCGLWGSIGLPGVLSQLIRKPSMLESLEEP